MCEIFDEAIALYLLAAIALQAVTDTAMEAIIAM